jgi:hypothetical protein
MAAGYKRDDAAPAGLSRVLPLSQFSASFTAPSAAADIHVVSTVMPPPATPFSCAVTVTGHGEDLEKELGVALTAAGYTLNSAADRGPARLLDYQKTTGTAVDRVMGLLRRDQPSSREAILIAFRVQDER